MRSLLDAKKVSLEDDTYLPDRHLQSRPPPPRGHQDSSRRGHARGRRRL